MWLVTARGFFSVVQHNDDKDALLVRSRARVDLERLCELPTMASYADEIVELPLPADYQFRIWKVDRADFGVALGQLLAEVDYPNFKDAIHRDNSKRASTYMRVWSAFLEIEGEDGGKRKYPSYGSYGGVPKAGDVRFEPDDADEQVDDLPRRTAHATQALLVCSESRGPVRASEVALFDPEGGSAAATGNALASARKYGLVEKLGRGRWVPTYKGYDLGRALEDRFLDDTEGVIA